MPALTDLLGHSQVENIVLACCMSVVGLSVVGIWLLTRPSSWLSKHVDAAVELPAREKATR